MQDVVSDDFLSKNMLRSRFSAAMSAMYQTEVPLYGRLIELVSQENNEMLAKYPQIKESLRQASSLSRLSEERHGAIRLGKASELFNIRRLFAVMGMEPVSYYDLTVAGIPVHSTAFRPIATHELSRSPFRVFTSLLRTDLIADESLRDRIHSLLENRHIFSEKLLGLIDVSEEQGGLGEADGDAFIAESLDVFRWHDEALVDQITYQALSKVHPLVADVVSFKGPHINHLTPATLNIDNVQIAMMLNSIEAKAIVEGPPTRQCPILLRQTSFKALKELVVFQELNNEKRSGSHRARFGEVEQRGVALTNKGQYLYDQLLAQTRAKILPAGDGSNAEKYVQLLEDTFKVFPDTHQELREQELAYYFYSLTESGKKNGAILYGGGNQTTDIEYLISEGCIRYDPIIYEDFLPVSAAGIFQSNLTNSDAVNESEEDSLRQQHNQAAFEAALGVKVLDRYMIYAQRQQSSIDDCLRFFKHD